jgi:hypothetical protein
VVTDSPSTRRVAFVRSDVTLALTSEGVFSAPLP